jgi:urease accessory protein
MQAGSLRYFDQSCAESMLQFVQSSIAKPDINLPVVELRVERRTLMKRLWRGTAADGVELGFELDAPLKHGDTVWQTQAARYVIVQEAEAVLEVLIGDLPASATAGIGWAVGNLHLEFSSEATRLLTPDEPAARHLFARIQINFNPTTAVFRPGRFKRSVGAPLVDELGPSHKH